MKKIALGLMAIVMALVATVMQPTGASAYGDVVTNTITDADIGTVTIESHGDVYLDNVMYAGITTGSKSISKIKVVLQKLDYGNWVTKTSLSAPQPANTYDTFRFNGWTSGTYRFYVYFYNSAGTQVAARACYSFHHSG